MQRDSMEYEFGMIIDTLREMGYVSEEQMSEVCDMCEIEGTKRQQILGE